MSERKSLIGARYPLAWLHVVSRGHRPRWRWYDVGWISIRGCETCEAKKGKPRGTWPEPWEESYDA